MFSFSVFAGISVSDSNNNYNNFYLSKPSLSVSDSSSKTVSVSCYSNSNIDDSLVAVAFFRKNSYGYDKLTAYDIDIKRKNGNKNVVFSHTVKYEGQYKVFCVEAYDLNNDGKFSSDEIEISYSKIITIGSSNSYSDSSEGKLYVYVRDSNGDLVNPYTSISVKDSYGNVVYSNVFVPSAGINLEFDKYYSIHLDYKGTVYDSSFYFKKENFDNSMSLKVDLDTDSTSSVDEDVSLNVYISPSSSSDGKFYYECTASGNSDFSEGKFYLKVGFDEILLEKGTSGSYYTVYNTAYDNSRSGYYNLQSKGSSKGSYGVTCKYVSSSGKIFYSYPKTFTYE